MFEHVPNLPHLLIKVFRQGIVDRSKTIAQRSIPQEGHQEAKVGQQVVVLLE